MGQGEVLKILSKSKKWMTAKEIHEKLDNSMTSISVALRKLYKNRDVLRKGERYGGRPNKWKIRN